MKSFLRAFAFLVGDSLLWVCVLAGYLWAFGALWFLDYLPVWLRSLLALLFLAAGLFLFVGYYWQVGVWNRPIMATGTLIVYLATWMVQPSNDRQWCLDQQLLPKVTIDGDLVTIQNFRDFRYRSLNQPIPKYKTLHFSLQDLNSVSFVVQRFTKFDGLAHTFVSFGLETSTGPEYFSISVEIRREHNEKYSPIRGIFRTYELMYVVGSEQDLVGVRTNVRDNDRVYLYRANASPEQVQQLFVEFAGRIDKLHQQPEFYNTLLNNCTTNIVAHTWGLTAQPINLLSPRIILPGYSAEVAYEHGIFGDSSVTYQQLKQQSRIDEKARAAGITDSFSSDIRRK